MFLFHGPRDGVDLHTPTFEIDPFVLLHSIWGFRYVSMKEGFNLI